MYERFYHLRERPFSLTPDPEYLYLSPVHREALDHLRLGVEAEAGFVVVTGEVGSGKTTLLQALLRSLDNRATIARLVNTLLEPKELLEAILIDLGLDPVPASKPAMVRDLARLLVEHHLQGQRVLVVIDEAQNLSRGALEELRMLSNLETEKSKLMQIVLVGQPDLRQRLASPHLEQLRQRITVRYHLAALDAHEVFNYVNHRLRCAALDKPMTFPREVTDAIHERSRGIPRTVNVICDAVLLVGYSEDRRQIDEALLQAAIEELEATGVLGAPIRRPWGRAPVDAAWPQPEREVVSFGTARERVRAADADTFRTAPKTEPLVAPDAGGRAPAMGHERTAPARPRPIWDRTRRLLFDPAAAAQKAHKNG